MTIVFISINSFFTSSIYLQHYTLLNGSEEYLSHYEGKKMLIVNIASESEFAAVQIPQLEQLYQQYHDSLIVICFPSNDFAKEPRSNSDIKLLMQNTYHTTFPISTKVGVKDSTVDLHPLFYWLQHQSENGNINTKIRHDFQKFLVDKTGMIIGTFSENVNPNDSTIIKAILE